MPSPQPRAASIGTPGRGPAASGGDAALRDSRTDILTSQHKVAHEGTRIEIAEARELLIAARKQLYQILAETHDRTDNG